ncbi:MATE family efflux transporter [Haloferax sp. Atlit-10N]|uniref:MATE family efflux transporter n=1 Tax=Haloferax TaxID=2251 RepID=UPI00067976E0|nr:MULTISPECIES: MATE family efflux transporter [Haloferax]RDZ39980.1 MATE family efflux transporter [Haloferax sp. Atlit-19N]RDZ40339.1 MATE family efflux transporter [Haloferax sp. Atlit-16N]RDZ56734.1 MATE family efflux transporter [Haloferax sp. Atlit-10N]
MGRVTKLRACLDGLFVGPSELELTEGGIARPLCYLAAPIVVTNLLQTAYNVADTLWLGRYSTEALAAISFAFPLVFLFLSLGLGLSIAGSVLVAQHTGAGESLDAERAAAQTLTYAAIAAVGVGAVAYVAVDDVLAFMGASPAVLPLATAYMRIVSLGMVFVFAFYAFISLMRGRGDTVTPMLVMAGSVALNVVLDPILIFGWWGAPELGIRGAAIATVCCRGLAAVVGVGILLDGRRGLRLRPGQFVPSAAAARRLFRLGLPTALEETGRAVSINLLLAVVGLFSTGVVAGYGVGTRIFSVVVLPTVAFASAVETMTGQNLGAGATDRATATNRFAAAFLFGAMSACGVVVWVAARPLVGLFAADATVVDAGVSFLRTIAPSFGFVGLMRVFTGGLRGAGRTTAASLIVILALGVVRIPAALWGASALGPGGIWVAFAASNVVGGGVASLWFYRTARRRSLARSGVRGAVTGDD